MKPYYADESVTLWHGDALDVLSQLPDGSVDSVVTDPPYGLEFMGKEWDSFGSDNRQPFRGEIQRPDNPYGRSTVRYGGTASLSNDQSRTMRAFGDWCEAWAAECLRVLKPGGHLLAFGGTRTWHRLACSVEDAGFEVRDSIAWMYGSGFPKSLDVSKAIDKTAGIWRGRAGEIESDNDAMGGPNYQRTDKGQPATAAAAAWSGWGTALKPAFEPIVVARKPLAGTVAANVLAHGTGALNIDACRVGDRGEQSYIVTRWKPGATLNREGGTWKRQDDDAPTVSGVLPSGRWPANVVLDEAQADALDEQSGHSASRVGKPRGADPGDGLGMTATGTEYDDIGGASRFFYIAKADTSERPRVNGTAHPTVKPLALMRWLVRLVTPPGGTVLEPFAGSGTTIEACIIEGFRCIASEREADYLPLIEYRIARRRDPVKAFKITGDDGGMFDLLDGEPA